MAPVRRTAEKCLGGAPSVWLDDGYQRKEVVQDMEDSSLGTLEVAGH